MGIQSSTNKFDFIKKSSSSTASSIPSSPLDIQIEHLETFILVWLDDKTTDNQNDELKLNLRRYLTNFINFDDVKSCEQWLKSRSIDEKILLIVSGRLGKRIVSTIHDLIAIIAIYIFCWIPEDHIEWTQTYSKIRRVTSKKEELIEQIFKDEIYFENIEDSKSVQIFKNRPHTKILDVEYVSIIWYQLFIEILVSSSYLSSTPSPKEFIEILHRSSSNDKESLNLINEFKQTYDKQNPIQCLIDNTPLARFLNRALREQNISLLFYLRFFIFDIYNQLISNQLSSSIYVYRKQLMSLKNIHSNINNYLMLNQFILTSIKQPDLSPIENNDEQYQTVFIEIDAQYHDGTRPFAYINDLSVLFMCGSIFKIISLEQNQNSTWKLKLSLTGNKELDFLNEKIIKLRKTNDLLMIVELLDQSNQSNKANIYSQQLIRQFPPNHPLIHRINNINSKIQPISLTSSKFLLIDLTKDNLSPLSLSMLNVLQSLINDSILTLNNYSDINFDQMKNKTIFIFTNSKIYSSIKKETQQPTKFFILEEDKNLNDQLGHFNKSEDLIFQLADQLYQCYIWEVDDDQRSGRNSQAIQKKEFANQIHKQLKEVYKNNPSTISIKTTIIWLKFNDNNDQIIRNTKSLFENIVSSFLIFDDREECFSHICTDEFNHSVFIIIDDNYKDMSIATLPNLNNVKKIYRYDSIKETKNGIRLQLTYDLISHYNQLANQCQNNRDSDNAKDMFLKARDLCELIIQF